MRITLPAPGVKQVSGVAGADGGRRKTAPAEGLLPAGWPLEWVNNQPPT
jgi:hypothetical protein